MRESTSERLWEVIVDVVNEGATVKEFIEVSREHWKAALRTRFVDSDTEWEHEMKR